MICLHKEIKPLHDVLRYALCSQINFRIFYSYICKGKKIYVMWNLKLTHHNFLFKNKIKLIGKSLDFNMG